MTDLLKALRAQVAWDDHTAEQAAEPTIGASWLSDKGIAFADGARYENARLAPLLSSLIAVVEAAEQDPCPLPYDRMIKAFADLRAAVRMGEKNGV